MVHLERYITVQPTHRSLQEDTGEEEMVQNYSVIDVKYIQQSDPEVISPQAVTFNYTFLWKDPQNTVFELTFSKPELVSAEIGEKDQILIEFNDTSIFKTRDGIEMEPGIKLKIDMPRQRAKTLISFDKGQM